MTLQQQFEQQIHFALDAGDESTQRDYAEHAGNWVDRELTEALCLGVIKGCPGGNWLGLLSTIERQAPALAAALRQLDQHVDRHRAEFMEEEAQRRIEANEALADAHHSLNAAYQGAA